MAQPYEHIEYLSKEIGARPAGTEEEQNAALYIADQFQKEANYHAEIEEFTTTSNFPYVKAICSGVIILVTILAMVVPMLAIPAFVLSLVATVIYVLEVFDRPFVSRALARSVSQNVVAKYQPFPEDDENSRAARSRKIVLVAHYDSSKVTPSIVSRVESLGAPLGLICAGSTVVATLLLLIRVFLGSMSGGGAILFNTISVIVLLVVALPLIRMILLQIAPYNEGANNNASGIAAMIEVARRISRGSLSEADLADEAEGVAIHGEAAAIANGLVPDGAEIRYEAERLTPPEMEPLDDEERLLSAKAAIAALTGKPVERKTFGSVADKLVNTRAGEGMDWGAPQDGQGNMAADANIGPLSNDEFAPVEWNTTANWPAAETQSAPSQTGYDDVVSGYDNAPSWFVAAQQKAKRPTGQMAPIQRSRYTEAIVAAEREAAERERIRQEEQRAREEAERAERERVAREAMLAAQAAQEAQRQQEREEQRAANETVYQPDYSFEGMPQPAQPEPFIEPDEEQQVFEDAEKTEALERVGLDEKAEQVEQPIEVEPVEDVQNEVVPPDATVAVAPIDMSDLREQLAAEEQAEAAQPVQNQMLYVDEERNYEDAPVRATRRRIASLPTIEDDTKVKGDSTSPSRSGMFRKLRSDVPSLSGVIRMQEAGEDVSQRPAPRVDPAMVPSLSGVVGKEPVDYDMAVDPEDQPYGDGHRSGWQGGAFSRLRLGHVDTKSGEESTADEPEEIEPIEEEEDKVLTGEIEKIYHFRNPLYNSEIWFVAIGSDTDAHDGALAFINEHQSELRGAMIVEIESLGEGELSVASEEGRYFKQTTSSRVKRFTRAAQMATGISLSNVSLAGHDSIASVVQKSGLQAMHLFGAEKGSPALKGSADDVLENIDENLLDDNINFLMELVKQS